MFRSLLQNLLPRVEPAEGSDDDALGGVGGQASRTDLPQTYCCECYFSDNFYVKVGPNECFLGGSSVLYDRLRRSMEIWTFGNTITASSRGTNAAAYMCTAADFASIPTPSESLYASVCTQEWKLTRHLSRFSLLSLNLQKYDVHVRFFDREQVRREYSSVLAERGLAGADETKVQQLWEELLEELENELQRRCVSGSVFRVCVWKARGCA